MSEVDPSERENIDYHTDELGEEATRGLFMKRSNSAIVRQDSELDTNRSPLSKYAVTAKISEKASDGRSRDGGNSNTNFVRPTGVVRGGTLNKLLKNMGTMRRSTVRRRALEKNNNEIIHTLSKFSSTEKSLTKSHSHRTLDADERHELHVMELKAFKQADEERHLHHELVTWKVSILNLLDSNGWEFLMVLLTVFALYGSDFNDYLGNLNSDATMDVLVGVTMAIFVVELVLLSIARRGYFLSLNFFLELVAAVSMLFDLKALSITEQLTGSGTAARAGRAARAGSRAGRLTRLLRILRLTRVFSLFLAFKRIQDTKMMRSHRQTEVEIFGTEEEIKDFKKQRGRSFDNSSLGQVEAGGNNGGNSPDYEEMHPDDEAGSMSRESYQRTTIDVILAMLVMLIGIMFLQYEPTCLSPEYEGLSQIDSLTKNISKISGTDNASIAVSKAIKSQLISDYLQDFGGECLHLEIRGTTFVEKNNELLKLLRPQELLVADILGDTAETEDEEQRPMSTATFNRREEFRSEAAASLSVTTVIIAIILLVIVKIKSNADALTMSVNNPLLKLCDDMVMVSDMHLEGPIIHLPSKVNEIRNAQLAFLKMKHALASFAKYVPYEVVRDMIAQGDGARLGVQSKEVTIFFSDIAGFTSICEALEPEDLLLLMSEYFDAMQKLIGADDSNGTLLEFIGDALLVVWNAPKNVELHAYNSIEQSIKMHEYLRKMKTTWDAREVPPISIRVGIHTAKVFVGNIGSPLRMKYGVLGDGVNLASRLEELNKRYNSKILISEATHEQPYVQKRFLTRPLDQVAVKGKENGTKIFEVLGRMWDVSDAEKEFAESQSKAFELYFDRKFSSAAAMYKKTAEMFEAERGYEDAAALLLEARCLDYAGPNPPPTEWDGTEVLKKKHF